MAEIVTESFCERCGTRYTFEAAIPKKRRIGRLKVLSKGLKNYVLSDDASLDEALADARSEDERERSGGQLDAFHQTFQFCMSCRQYTCANCWNDAEGRCLSCAPLSLVGGQHHSPLDDLLAGGGMAPLIVPAPEADVAAPAWAANGNGHSAVDEPPPAVVGSAWPTIDLQRDLEAPASLDLPPAEPVVAADAAEAEAAILTGAEVLPVADKPASAEILPVADEPASPGAVEQVAEPPEAELAAAAELPEPAAAEFWTRPFTGFAPVEGSTNGHDVSAPVDERPAADLGEMNEPASPVVEEQVAASVAEPQVAEAPVAEAPVAEAPVVEPAGAALPEPFVPAPMERPAPLAGTTPDARAGELADRTTRLLGRFRVAPRSAASSQADEPAAAVVEPVAPWAEPAEPAPFAAPPIEPPQVVAEVAPVPAHVEMPAAVDEPAPIEVPDVAPVAEVAVIAEAASPTADALPEPTQAVAEAEPVAPPDEEPASPPAPPPAWMFVAAPPAAGAPAPDAAPQAPAPTDAPAWAGPMAPPPMPTPAAVDRVEMPAWPTAPRAPRADAPAPVPPFVLTPPAAPPAVVPLPVAQAQPNRPVPSGAPQWPTPLQPGVDASSTPFWASGDAAKVAREADLWRASAQEVAGPAGQAAAQAGIQSCVSCGLSLSSTARFCRRCGSRQG